MKTKVINGRYHSNIIVINGMKYIKGKDFLTLAEPINKIIDQFHTYKQKQMALSVIWRKIYTV